MNKNTTIGVVAAVILLIVIIVWSNRESKIDISDQVQDSNGSDVINDNNNNVATPPSESETAVRTKVLTFGRNAKLVSITAADFISQVQVHYGALVTPKLIAEWKATPRLAFGKTEEKVWPDRIEIVSVTKQDGETYKVLGNVINVGPDSAKTLSTYPVTITVELQNGSWLITAVSK